jgi:hypothetical protein
MVELNKTLPLSGSSCRLENEVTSFQAMCQRREELLRELGADATTHGDRVLLNHLRGVYALLYRWRGDDAVSRAGLFHSVYGSQAFPVSLALETDRLRVKMVIGEKSEVIAYAFGRSDRNFLFQSGPAPAKLLDRITGEKIDLDLEFLQALVEIEAANMLEQTPPLWRLDSDIREALPVIWTPWLALLSRGAVEDLQAYLRGERSIHEIRDCAGIPRLHQAQ